MFFLRASGQINNKQMYQQELNQRSPEYCSLLMFSSNNEFTSEVTALTPRLTEKKINIRNFEICFIQLVYLYLALYSIPECHLSNFQFKIRQNSWAGVGSLDVRIHFDLEPSIWRESDEEKINELTQALNKVQEFVSHFSNYQKSSFEAFFQQFDLFKSEFLHQNERHIIHFFLCIQNTALFSKRSHYLNIERASVCQKIISNHIKIYPFFQVQLRQDLSEMELKLVSKLVSIGIKATSLGQEYQSKYKYEMQVESRIGNLQAMLQVLGIKCLASNLEHLQATKYIFQLKIDPLKQYIYLLLFTSLRVQSSNSDAIAYAINYISHNFPFTFVEMYSQKNKEKTLCYEIKAKFSDEGSLLRNTIESMDKLIAARVVLEDRFETIRESDVATILAQYQHYTRMLEQLLETVFGEALGHSGSQSTVLGSFQQSGLSHGLPSGQ